MRSFFSWIGGKKRLAAELVAMLPEHETYVEAFGGAAWVLFRKPPEWSRAEVYNDLSGDLANLFRVVKTRPRAFVRWQELNLHSRRQYHEHWERYKRGEWRTDVERAAMFYHVVRMAFGAKPGAGWGYGLKGKPRYNLSRRLIMGAHARLKRVYIENQDFEALVRAWDHPGALFYLDPPYTTDLKPGARKYAESFGLADHERLAALLREIEGMFMLSYNDSPLVRDLYRGFHIRELKTRYTLEGGGGREAREVVITNFEAGLAGPENLPLFR